MGLMALETNVLNYDAGRLADIATARKVVFPEKKG
jgi:hypothetical protein